MLSNGEDLSGDNEMSEDRNNDNNGGSDRDVRDKKRTMGGH